MTVTIIAVGSLKEKYWSAAVAEYAKRLKPYAHINIVEISEEKPGTTGNVNKYLAKRDLAKEEGVRILSHINGREYVIALTIDGKTFSSPDFASFLHKQMTMGVSCITFVIGGSTGLSNDVRNRADMCLSFSCFTFPHQLMRVVLLEQIYRWFKIIRGEPYHK